MITELAIPATIVQNNIAVPLFVTSFEVWFGQLSECQNNLWLPSHWLCLDWSSCTCNELAFAKLVMWQLSNAVHKLQVVG